MKIPVFSILVPTYNSEKVIGPTLKSILAQTFTNFEIIVGDNQSTDSTKKVIEGFKDERIKYFLNEKNLGYPGNLRKCFERARGKFLYLMGSDDILAPAALKITLDAFSLGDDIGAVTRPYYWFEGDAIKKAVRVVEPLDSMADRVISIFDGEKEFRKVFESVGQLSGLAIRRDLVEEPVNPDIFTAHIYPFLSVFKKHKIVFLKDYLVAVRIFSSMSRSSSSIYEPSPTYTWIKMFEKVLKGKKYDLPRQWGIRHICLNFEGLVQIKNYARFPLLYKEIGILLKYQPSIIISPKFWVFALGTILTPKILLIKMVDYYKSKINAGNLTGIRLLSK